MYGAHRGKAHISLRPPGMRRKPYIVVLGAVFADRRKTGGCHQAGNRLFARKIMLQRFLIVVILMVMGTDNHIGLNLQKAFFYRHAAERIRVQPLAAVGKIRVYHNSQAARFKEQARLPQPGNFHKTSPFLTSSREAAPL